MDAGAILHIGEDRRIVLDARYRWLSDLQRSVTERREAGELAGGDDTYRFLRKILSDTSPELQVEELLDTGSVLEVGDGVAVVSGLKSAGSQELVEFESGVFGLAFSLHRDKVGCILLGAEEDIREGSEVVRTGHLLKVPVGEMVAGRIVNSLGQPIDGKGPIAARTYAPVERKAPGVIDRMPVSEPLHTGIKVLDSLVPLGRGQRELIIGDRKIGKTTAAVDTILSQKGGDVFCVYASIGQKSSSVARVVEVLTQYGAMDYTCVVVALPNEQPAFRHLTPYTACAIGEYFMDRGKHALVVYDDLSKHAYTYREVSALLKRPIGREAYPGDIFYVHSRLLERAARMSDEHGGGSLTALPIVETLAGDISAFIPTNVVSICDGQIFLDAGLFNEGFRPAMDVGLSVSRVGGSAQTKAMKQVAGRLRIDLAQYQEMAQFVKFGAEVDAATLGQLARGERGRELLKQDQHAPMPGEHEVVVLFAVVNGFLDDIPTEDLPRLQAELIRFCQLRHPQMLERLRQEKALDRLLEDELRQAVFAFKDSFAPAAEGGEDESDVEDVFEETGEDRTAEDAAPAEAVAAGTEEAP
ncbi:MAG: F0F1 ATP synthase subunit alpha [Coriobacteriia bacterium]|nr:F0F1 ATP synthase subunit alpha [Coriobacteriia bacterium]